MPLSLSLSFLKVVLCMQIGFLCASLSAIDWAPRRVRVRLSIEYVSFKKRGGGRRSAPFPFLFVRHPQLIRFEL